MLSQGFRDSPHLFGQALSKDLGQFIFPSTKVLQNVDDLLLCAPLEETSEGGTKALLNFQAEKGYKVSKDKAQLCFWLVKYLGLNLSKKTQVLGEDQIGPSLSFPRPWALKQLRGFLDITGYCRLWSLGYGKLACPLSQLVKEAQKDNLSILVWEPEAK